MDFVIIPPIPEERDEMEEAWVAVDSMVSLIRTRTGVTSINMRNGMYINTPLAPQEVFESIISVGTEPVEADGDPDKTPIPDSILKSMEDADEDDDNMLA